MNTPFLKKYQPNFYKEFAIDKEFIVLLNTLKKMDNLNILLIGNSGCGKTSLLYATIREYYNLEKIPKSNVLYINNLKETDIIVAFDLLEHIEIENRNYLIKSISNLNFKKLFINLPNEFGPAILIKNIGSKLIGYKRDHEYSFADTLNATFYRFNKLSPHIDCHKGLDWRHTAYLLNYYFFLY